MRLTCQIEPKPGARRSVWFLLLLLSLFAPFSRGAEEAVSETEAKAIFIYNCARFTEWPAAAFANESAPIRLGVIGDEEFAKSLATLLKDRKAHGRAFEIKRIALPTDARNMHILYVPAGETRKFPQYYDVVKKTPVLTIGESGQFLDAGGIINLLIEEEQVRFEIHPEAAESAKLVISSRLMRLAKTIKRGEVKK